MSPTAHYDMSSFKVYPLDEADDSIDVIGFGKVQRASLLLFFFWHAISLCWHGCVYSLSVSVFLCSAWINQLLGHRTLAVCLGEGQREQAVRKSRAGRKKKKSAAARSDYGIKC